MPAGTSERSSEATEASSGTSSVRLCRARHEDVRGAICVREYGHSGHHQNYRTSQHTGRKTILCLWRREDEDPVFPFEVRK